MKQINMVDIYMNYIKKQGDFDFGIDDLERIGLRGILIMYRLEISWLTKEEKEELWRDLKQMAEENDFNRDFEEINRKG